MDATNYPDRFKSLLKLLRGVMYTLDPSGNLTYLSPSFEKVTGWKKKKWLGKNFVELLHPDDVKPAIKVFKKTLKGITIPLLTLRVRASSGEYLTGDFSCGPDVVDGKIVGQIGIGRDITLQKKTEEKYQHYANLVKSSDAAIISRGLDGRILTWNRAAERLFGFKAREVIGRNFSIIIPPEKKNELGRIDKIVKRGKALDSYETERVRKDGTRLPIIAKVSPIFDANGEVMGISVFDRDNTQRKREEREENFVKVANQVLTSSLDYVKTLNKLAKLLVPDLADWSTIHMLDNEGKFDQIAVAHVDPKKVKWALEFQKKRAREVNESEQDKQQLESLKKGESMYIEKIDDKLIKRMVKRREDRDIIKKLALSSSIRVPIIHGDKVMGSMTLIRTNDHFYDQQDLKFAQEIGRLAGQAVNNARLYREAQEELYKRQVIQEELRQSRDQLSVILENVADGITVQDSSGRLVYANEAAAISAGYTSADDMINNPGKWFARFELRQENGEPLSWKDLPGRRALKGEVDPVQVINYVDRNTKEERWSVVKARPVFDERGKVKAVVNIVNDITQSKELEQRKDDFISIASHELKTPVTSIKGFVHLLKKDRQEYERNHTFLTKVDRQLDRLTELIEDLLDLSRIQSGKIVYRVDTFDIGSLVHDVVSDISRMTGTHKIVLNNGVHKKIKGDRDRISQVLINLMTNAIKYSPQGKEVIVTIKEDMKGVRVSVRDHGMGIPDQEKDKIFDRFYRAQNPQSKTYPGLGIGLFICREIIARHRGKIWVESEEGKGSTFNFRLPAKQ